MGAISWRWVREGMSHRVPLFLSLWGSHILALLPPRVSMDGVPQPWLRQLVVGVHRDTGPRWVLTDPIAVLIGAGAPTPLHGGWHLFAMAWVGRVLDRGDGLDHGGLHRQARPLQLRVAFGREVPLLKVQKVPDLLQRGQCFGSVMRRPRMEIPQLSPLHLLQASNPSVHLVVALVAGRVLIAAHGLLTVLLRLVDLPQLLPKLGLPLITQQGLDAAVDGLKLPMQGSGGQIPRGEIALAVLPHVRAMVGRQVRGQLWLTDTGGAPAAWEPWTRMAGTPGSAAAQVAERKGSSPAP